MALYSSSVGSCPDDLKQLLMLMIAVIGNSLLIAIWLAIPTVIASHVAIYIQQYVNEMFMVQEHVHSDYIYCLYGYL